MMAIKPRFWTPAEDAELTQLAEQGINRVAIARQLNRSLGAIERRAARLGVRLPPAAGPALPSEKSNDPAQ
jgi:hypothetical protein